MKIFNSMNKINKIPSQNKTLNSSKCLRGEELLRRKPSKTFNNNITTQQSNPRITFENFLGQV